MIAPASSILETDRRYFELGSELARSFGSEVAHMPGLSHLPAAAVAHRIDHGLARSDPPRWLDGLDVAFRGIGASVQRVYLPRPIPPLDEALLLRGFARRVERCFLASGPLPSGGAEIRLAEPSDHDIEELSGLLTLDAGDSPDGHGAGAGDFIELHRRKRATSEFDWFVARDTSGRLVGTVGALGVGPVYRAKNLWIEPSARRHGIGSAMLAELQNRHPKHDESFCTFAVAGSTGEQLYRSLGMRAVVDWFEWSRPLG